MKAIFLSLMAVICLSCERVSSYEETELGFEEKSSFRFVMIDGFSNLGTKIQTPILVLKKGKILSYDVDFLKNEILVLEDYIKNVDSALPVITESKDIVLEKLSFVCWQKEELKKELIKHHPEIDLNKFENMNLLSSLESMIMDLSPDISSINL